MKKIKEILNQDGPKDVFIFYSFLLCNRKNELVVSNFDDIRKTFLMELKSNKDKYSYLHKHIRKDLTRDIIKSYLFIKNHYFN